LESIIRLIDESFRVLDSGGLLIFETPNPENIQVGACNFYLDPTHRNPIPPPVLKFFLESRGFEQVEVLRLNPSIAEPVDGDSDLVQRFNKLFYGPMDYAVIGRRGGA
jgi:O-antigen chain-terminating methyltransferase